MNTFLCLFSNECLIHNPDAMNLSLGLLLVLTFAPLGIAVWLGEKR